MVHKSPAPNLKEQVFTIGGISVHDGGIAQAPDSAGAPKSVHDAPESVFTILRNWCSRSSGISVHDRPKFAGSFYLHISITIPAPGVPEPSGSLGVNCVAVTSNKKFHTAKKIHHKKACYKRK